MTFCSIIRHNCPPKRKTKVYRSPTSPQTTQQKMNTRSVNPRGTTTCTLMQKATISCLKKKFVCLVFFFCSDHPPSVGRFVTRRRRNVTTKSKNPKVSFNLFNSSDDSSSGALGSSRVLRRRKVPPAIVPSCAENSENLSGISSFPPNTLKDIPLNVLSDHTLGSRSRKPIFCSTPSAGHFPNRPCLKSTAVSHTTEQWGSPAVSVSSADVLKPFQHDLDSLGHSGLHSEEKLRLSFGEQETSGELFVKTKMTRSCREGRLENSVVIENKRGEGSLNGNLSSRESFESNSHFLPATGGREWLINALKEKCLRVPCTVQLARLYNPTVSQLCTQTTYSSCLGHSHKGYSCQISEPFHLHLSVSCDKTNASVLSVDSQSSSASPSKKPKGQSTSLKCVKTSRNPTRHKKRSTSTDRSGTIRKAGVSGLSVNRWKHKDSSIHTSKNPTADGRSNKAVDRSISEMIAAKSQKPYQMKVRHTHGQRRHA